MKPLTILKIGGNVIDAPAVLEDVLGQVAAMTTEKILVHGGGKIASRLMQQLGIEPRMVDGRRITDKPSLDIVTMVYAGLINKNIVATLQRMGCNAIGLSGADANVVPAVRRPVREVDYGFVGDVRTEDVGINSLRGIVELGLTPVLAPITHDRHGCLLNTNADTVASSVAIAAAAHYDVQLVFCFDKNGVLRAPDDESSAIDFIDETLFARYKNEGIITAGMIPKLENAFAALHSGVTEVRLCSPTGIAAGGTRIRL